MAADLAVVIVNWNTRDLLQGCLGSLRAERFSLDFDVWVVDNDSVDDSLEMLVRQFPEIKIIANPRNQGYAQANNQAIARCSNPYVFLLNPDTMVRPGALKVLSDYLKRNPDVGVVGGKLLNPDGSCQSSCRRFPSWPTAFSGDLWLKRQSPDQLRQVDWLSGAAWMIKREVFAKAGLLDEKLFLFSEEIDLCYRARRAGYRTVYLPQAQIVHHQGASVKQWSGDEYRQLTDSLFYFYAKHHGPIAAAVFRGLTRLGWLARWGKWKILSGFDRNNELYRQRSGLYAGMLKIK